MPIIRSYHRGRQQVEETMATNASSAAARIVHCKLAALHGRSADRAEAELALTAGEADPFPVLALL